MSAPEKLLVTGGGSGLGARMIRVAIESGGQAVALDVRDAEGVASLGGARFLECDVTDAQAVGAAVDRAAALLGGIDGVFAAAGMLGTMAPIEHLDPADWRRTMAVNLDGVFYTLRAVVPHMTGGGGFVATSSIAGILTYGTPGAIAYMTAKSGLVALVKGAAVELARHKIRVNAIAPGAVPGTRLLTHGVDIHHTEELAHERLADIPLGGETSVDDVAGLVGYLLSDAGSRITGVVIPIDAGQSLLGGGKLKRKE
jgi:NAD(P)-dependent dehydrogenase (short-subunit alcohol dehydrogenase family)